MKAKRTWKAIVAILLLVPMAVSGAAEDMADGSAADVSPPVITHTPPEHFRAGAPLRIHARVTDDSGVHEVTLFHRDAGEQEYRQLSMRRERASDFYVAELPPGSGPRIEYFIRATDTVGNTLLGRLFDPYATTVLAAAPEEPGAPGSAATVIPLSSVPAGAPPAANPVLTADEPRGGMPRWVWIGLGALAVAAVASGAGGGGGGGGAVVAPGADPGSDPGAAPGAGSGTVTITAPVP